MLRSKPTMAAMILGLAAAAALAAPAKIEVERAKGCNLFPVGTPVRFNAVIRSLPAGAGEVIAAVTDFSGATRTVTIPVEAKSGELTRFAIDLGTPEPGYYEMKVTLKLKAIDGKEVLGDATTYVTRVENPGEKKIEDTDPFSFGVVHPVNRTAEQARQGGFRFGLKTFQIGAPGVWWRKGTVYDLNEIVDATAGLGLQWTRHQFNQSASAEPGVISTVDLATKHSMNVVLKIEGFPEDCYDAARYGPLEAWKEKNKKKAYNRCTVPIKATYQQWLKDEIAKLPADQNVFEIGNEVWDYMSAEEFAEWCQMTREVVKQVRPEAKIGADPGGRPEFATAFMEKGGMDGMDIIYCHPYSFTPLPEHRTRPLLRNLRDIVREKTGKTLDIYVTEYGWPTAAKDRRKHSVSEALQAQRTARQSIMMYGEDIKTLIPHWMADREQDITERENWFGFFRLSGQPKPVLIAHANSARMIDGSRFVGDLWCGPGIGAMLFERAGEYTLALWTAEQALDADVNIGVPQIKVVDLMGRETTEKTADSHFRRKLDGSVVYLVGVSPELAKRVAAPDQELNADLWSIRSGTFSVPSAKSLTIDGKLDDWGSDKPMPLTGNEKVGVAETRMRWDREHVYVSVKVADLDPTKPGTLKIGIGSKPSRQQTTPSMYDCVLTVKRDATGTKAAVDGPLSRGKPIDLILEDPSGIRWAAQSVGKDWIAEVAIPIAYLKGFPEAKAQAKFSARISYEKGEALLETGPALARLWPYMILSE